MSEKERLQLENELLLTCSKAQAINKYIDELEESSKLSELWCKSQQENQQLKDRIDKAIKKLSFIGKYFSDDERIYTLQLLEANKKVMEILKGEDNE